MDDMIDKIIIREESNIEVIKHRIYELRGQHLNFQIRQQL